MSYLWTYIEDPKEFGEALRPPWNGAVCDLAGRYHHLLKCRMSSFYVKRLRVYTEIRLKTGHLTSRLFEVAEGHRNRHGSIGYP